MIKAKTTNGDMLLGLSKINLKKLQEGMPIAFNLSDIFPGMQGKCIIMYGDTEESIMQDLHIGPNTEINPE